MSQSGITNIEITLEDDGLVIRMGTEMLFHAVQAADTWPMDGNGIPAKILDKELFLQEFIAQLQCDDETGATVLHYAFDKAATEVMESGSESVEVLDDYEDD